MRASGNGPRQTARHGQNERPIALNRQNAHFAGNETGAENRTVIASLIETFKMNGVDPGAWLTATLAAIAKRHKQSQIDGLRPWNDAVAV